VAVVLAVLLGAVYVCADDFFECRAAIAADEREGVIVALGRIENMPDVRPSFQTDSDTLSCLGVVFAHA
jgi:hypothetical protein